MVTRVGDTYVASDDNTIGQRMDQSIRTVFVSGIGWLIGGQSLPTHSEGIRKYLYDRWPTNITIKQNMLEVFLHVQRKLGKLGKLLEYRPIYG